MPRQRTVSDDQILRAMAETVGEKGPAEFTLADVGAKAGLSPATLLQRFGSKRGLLLQLAESGPSWAEVKFIHAAARERSPRKALIAALKAMATPVDSPEAMANNLAFLHIDLSDPDFHTLAQKHAKAFRGGIEAFLNDAKKAGEIAPETDARRLAEAVETVYNGALITWAIHRKGKLGNHLQKQLETLLAPYSG